MTDDPPRATLLAPVPVSVLIPCFNNEAYLRDCVASVLAGQRPDQIVIVDDCSTDRSLEVARQLAAEQVGILVIAHENNLGAAAARRTALEVARHVWVSLVDADDLLEAGAIGEAFDIARAAEADICIWDMWRIEGEERWPNMTLHPGDFPKSGHEALLDTLGAWRIHPLGVARKGLYESAYANFEGTMVNADELITRLLFANARRVAFCPRRYFYRRHPTSATQAYSERRLTTLEGQLWLLAFVSAHPDLPLRRVAMDAIAEAWGYFRNRTRFPAGSVHRALEAFIPEWTRRAEAFRWLWRRPKHLAALTAMRLWLAIGGRG